MIGCRVFVFAICTAIVTGCNGPSVSVGTFTLADAAQGDSLSCETISKSTAFSTRLPIVESTLAEGLPSFLQLGPIVARRSFVEPFDIEPSWGHGGGAYASSLSEFGEEGHSSSGGWHTLRIVPKTEPTSGLTDRMYWGGELTSPAAFGHGLFLARVRADGWQDVHSAFFFANDKIAANGSNLGWSGAVLEFTHNGTQQRMQSLWNDSSANKHEYKLIEGDAPAQKDWLLGLVSLPGRIAVYVDGQLVDERQDTDTLAMWRFHFTHWISNPSPRTFVPSSTAVGFAIDYVAHYAVDVCP
jgi:hypothetical protein